MRKFARRLPLLALLALVVIAAIVLLQPGPLAEHLRKVVQTELAKQLGRPVSIRHASVTVTGAVVLRDVVIKNEDGSPLLKAPVMEARIGGLRKALRGSAGIEVRSVHLDRPQLELVRRPDGSWSVSDLIERTGKKPGAFRATVTADDARIKLVDHTRGGQTTSIENVRVSLKQPSAGRTQFRIRAGANEGILDSLDVRGETDSSTNNSKIGGKVVGLSVPYAVERVPGMSFLTASAGVADVDGKLSFGGSDGDSKLSYDATAELRDAEVGFPWLRRPIKGIAGKLELADGDFTFDGMTGTVEGAPVQLDGQILDVPQANFALDLTVTGIRYPQLRALFPRVAFPAGLLLPSPMRVQAKIEGPAGQVKVSGEATVKVVKFHAIPWHDLAGKFEYQNGRLKISKLRAHGSPRRFEADIEIDFRNGARATGTAALVNIPLSVLAETAGIKGDFRGTAKANIRGATADGGTLSGDFTVDAAAVQGVELGRLSGRFTYRQGGVALTGVRIRGPTAEGVINTANISLSGGYSLHADLARLNLGAAGAMLSIGGLRGQCCARIQASGQIRAGRASARVVLDTGEIQGRRFDSLSARVNLTREEARLTNVVFLSGAVRGEGQLTVSGWRLPRERAQVRGRLVAAGIPLAELLPRPPERLSVSGVLRGTADISGALSSPVVTADIEGEGVELAGQSLPVATARLTYRRGRLVPEDINLRTADGSLTVTGGLAQSGSAIDAQAKRLDLAVINAAFPELTTRFGLALTGALDLSVRVTGPIEQPSLRFTGSLSPLSANGEALDGLSASGELTGSSLHLDSCSLRWQKSSITLTGDVDGLAETMDLRADFVEVDLGTLLRIGDRAAYRIYRAAKQSQGREAADRIFDNSFYRRYARIPRPLSGLLSSQNVECSGALAEPRIAASFTITDFAFEGRSVQKITGDGIAVSLRRDASGRLAIGEATGRLHASQQLAEAWATARVTPDGELSVDLQTGNLQLDELGLWLDLPVPLKGQARIDVRVTGTTARPLVQGGVFVDNLAIGSLPELESLSAYPIQLTGNVLSVEDLVVRKGPMEATGSASIPVDVSHPGSLYNLLAVAMSTADLSVRKGEFQPVTAMEPIRFDADLHARAGTLYLTDGAGPTGPNPGLRGTMGAGSFTVGGTIGLGQLAMGEWSWVPRYDVTATFDRAEIAIPRLFRLTVDGQLDLTNDPAGHPLITTVRGDPPTQHPLTISDATVTFEQPERFRSTTGNLFAPRLDVQLQVGSNVWVRRGGGQRPTAILVDPARAAAGVLTSGYLNIGGIMTGEGVTLEGEFESHQGQLGFPNGLLALRRATAWVTRAAVGDQGRAAGQPPVVTVSAEAEGRVGDYLVSFSPVGQVYPPQPRGESALALNLESLPRLESAYVLALLSGPVVAPSRGGQPDLATMLAEPTSANGGGGEITGIRLPAFGNPLGMQEFSLDLALSGPVKLRVGQRLLKRLVISYVGTLSGPVESRTLKLNYEVTPRYAIGYGVNELDQGRWEVNAFVPF
ncbi:MAG: translocation/assembly module TamB domain-containing protein [Armatimonadota bacterium]